MVGPPPVSFAHSRPTPASTDHYLCLDVLFYVDAAIRLHDEYERVSEDAKESWLAEQRKKAEKVAEVCP